MRLSGHETMTRVLIVACGNPLRCDDGLAWRAAEELRRRNWPQEIEIIVQHQLTPELAPAISQVGRVLFLDAARNSHPGEIRCDPVLPQQPSGTLTHNFLPAGILSMAQELYGNAPPAYVISIDGECFDHGETISAAVEAALPGFVDLIVRLVEEVLRTCEQL